MVSTGKSRVLVAMSGGVDSSVAAALLLEQGHDVVGVFMRNGSHSPAPADSCYTPIRKQGCCSVDDANDARMVADSLGVPFYAVNFEQEFGRIIDYFISEYRRGRTPNPCVVCNSDLKFGHLMALADDIGADAVATGHYARVERRTGSPRLLRGVDRGKDQSYFLFGLSQPQLARCIFPLGGMTKAEVRAAAAERGLRTRNKPESQEICFVPTNDYRDVLRERAPDALSPGHIVGPGGDVLGEHGGAAGYTVGQRRGLGIGGLSSPLFVTAVDTATNTVMVGPREDLHRTEFIIERPVLALAVLDATGDTSRVLMQLRSRSVAVPGTVRLLADGSLWATLDEPTEAVTPGQACVLYSEDEPALCLGGGWIGLLEA